MCFMGSSHCHMLSEDSCSGPQVVVSNKNRYGIPRCNGRSRRDWASTTLMSVISRFSRSLYLVSLSVCDSVSVVVLYSSSAVATNHILTPRSGNGAVILYMRRRRYDRGHPGPRERCRPNAISCLVQCNGNREPEPWRWN